MTRNDLRGDLEWERIIQTFKTGSIDALIEGLHFIADFDKYELKESLFEYAAQTMEVNGFKPSENVEMIKQYMLTKLIEIGKEIYLNYSNSLGDIHLYSRGKDVNSVVSAEKEGKRSYTHAWVVSSHSVLKKSKSGKKETHLKLPVISR